MLDWLNENKVAAAYVLGAISATVYALLVHMEIVEQAARNAVDDATDEVKHDRRSARKSA